MCMLETSTEYSQGFGQVGYGDTAFKRWNMEVGVTGIVKYNNLLDSKQASIQAGKDININTQSQDNARQINNSGKNSCSRQYRIFWKYRQ